MTWWRRASSNPGDVSYSFSVPSGAINEAALRQQLGLPSSPSKPPRPKPSAMFAGTSEFSMGTAVGVRSWDVDELGRLVSPQFRMVWPPGEVLAKCRVNETRRASAHLRGFYLGYAGIDVEEQPEPAQQEAEDHQQADCTCGFYAYYEGYNEYADHEARITGVIEGYGETQIGTRGFKSAKARIVALYVPASNSYDTTHIGATRFDRVRTNYSPHVAVFDDYSLMLAEFPTTQQDASTPDSDPDFWTRSI